MMEIIFNSFWSWLGTVILLCILCGAICSAIDSIRR